MYDQLEILLVDSQSYDVAWDYCLEHEIPMPAPTISPYLTEINVRSGGNLGGRRRSITRYASFGSVSGGRFSAGLSWVSRYKRLSRTGFMGWPHSMSGEDA